MRYLIGLGNPGLEYENTRHNVGHFVIDEIGQMPDFELIRTDCFMNNSGGFVKRVVQEKKIDLDSLIIVHDDWVFEVGDFKIQKGRGSNNHNGVQDIIDKLGTKDFWRVRIGIGSVPNGVAAHDYVLSKFKKSEIETVLGSVVNVKKELRAIINE